MKPEDRKEFCPNCEAVVPCTHEAELFVCDICGEDFAKYIVSRKADVSDYSMTQDVLTDIKTPRSIENKLTDTEACNARLVEQVEQLTAELAGWKADAERLAKFQYEHSFVEFEAKVWVSEWMKSIKNDRSIATSEATMLGWFSNAIMAGYYKARAELAEVNEKAVFIQFENEDELPPDIPDDVYSKMFNCSHVDCVRLFPYIEKHGKKYYLVDLENEQ
jgi:transcription elongation factor Elf1